MKLNLTADSWLVPALTLAAAVAYTTLWFIPQQHKISQLREELATKRTFVTQGCTLPTALQATQCELEKTQLYQRAWADASPGRTRLSALFGQISALAKQSGIATTRFDPDPGQDMSRLCRVPLAIGCTGSFAQTRKFLHGIESLPATIWVEKLHVARDSKDGKVVQSVLDLEIFADKQDISDQVNHMEQPIREETGRNGAFAPRGPVTKP